MSRKKRDQLPSTVKGLLSESEGGWSYISLINIKCQITVWKHAKRQRPQLLLGIKEKLVNLKKNNPDWNAQSRQNHVGGCCSRFTVYREPYTVIFRQHILTSTRKLLLEHKWVFLMDKELKRYCGVFLWILWILVKLSLKRFFLAWWVGKPLQLEKPLEMRKWH